LVTFSEVPESTESIVIDNTVSTQEVELAKTNKGKKVSTEEVPMDEEDPEDAKRIL
jgi:hypothetical protein